MPSPHTTTNVTVRLTTEERAALQSHVDSRREPYSVLIRKAMDGAGLFKPVRSKRGTLQSAPELPSHDHKIGRPLRSSSHSTMNITIRLTQEERAALQWHVEARAEPCSVLVREAAEQAGLFLLRPKR